MGCKEGFFLSTRFQVFCLRQKTKPDQVLGQTEHIHFFTIFETAFEATSKLTIHFVLAAEAADSYHTSQFQRQVAWTKVMVSSGAHSPQNNSHCANLMCSLVQFLSPYNNSQVGCLFLSSHTRMFSKVSLLAHPQFVSHVKGIFLCCILTKCFLPCYFLHFQSHANLVTSYSNLSQPCTCKTTSCSLLFLLFLQELWIKMEFYHREATRSCSCMIHPGTESVDEAPRRHWGESSSSTHSGEKIPGSVVQIKSD